MRNFALQLKATSADVHAPAAWFIPGAHPAAWVEELSRWEVPMRGMRLWVVPASARNRGPIGVLVIPPKEVAAGRVLRGQPYGLIGRHLFVPANATLNPPVSDAELDKLLRLEIYVFHPSAGLIGFAADESLRVADLLERPVQRRTDWTRAVPADANEPRLLAVEPTDVPALDQILDSGRDDIGSAVEDPLGPSPDESPLARLGQAAALPPLIAASLLTSLPLAALDMLSRWARRGNRSKISPGGRGSKNPATGGAGGSLRNFNKWAKENLSRLSKALLDARAREIRRLMRMLEDNPEEGLRHAIPLSGPRSRGIAPPGWRLARRNIEFSLARLLGGSGRADPWSMPPDVVNDLRRRYREAATRELSLGRYGRAAYVFAQLLGDYSAAAAALEQGRSFREAAVLYRDRLKNLDKAAQCLEKGGLLQEAAHAYEQLNKYEKAGDVYRQMENFEEAERCYRNQVRSLLSLHHDLPAARLLEGKLGAPDEALAVLHDAWPGRDPTGQCLRESFALLGRLARHEQSLSRLRALRNSAPIGGRESALVTVLAAVATDYPESSVRDLSADATRVVAGCVLSDPTAPDHDSIARAVSRLVPQDKLLARDVTRFLDKPKPRPAVQSTLRQSGDPAVLRQFRLPDGVLWHAVAPVEGGFCAAGMTPKGLYLVRGSWDGRLQVCEMYPTSLDLRQCRLYPVPDKPLVFLLSPNFRPNRTIVLRPTDAVQTPVKIVVPDWLNGLHPLALANSGAGVTYVVTRDAIQTFQSESGGIRASSALPGPPPDSPVDLVSTVGHLYITWGSAVLHYTPARGESSRLQHKVVDMPTPSCGFLLPARTSARGWRPR